jgi:hypothetical protein
LGFINSVWIGLIGVIVGGLITTAWSWLAVIRQELSDAMVSARLVYENLIAAEHRVNGQAVLLNSGVWDQNRAALARVLGKQDWIDVSVAFREGSPPDKIIVAREALERLVSGKRYIVGKRWRTLFGR